MTTQVTVAVVSEVSARVLPNASNTLATSTPETVGFIEKVISWVMNLI